MTLKDKKTAPTLSIVIPTRNKVSQKALDSCGSLPVIVEKDPQGTGAGPTRNRAIAKVHTEWVGFLDDDDVLTPDYAEAVRSAIDRDGLCECIIFRMRHPVLGLVPRIPEIELGNVGISFCLKTEIAKKHPFVKEDPSKAYHEDYELLKELEEAGYNIHFSKHICYEVGEK